VRKFIKSILILSVIVTLAYYLFIPEFKKSTNINEAYIYIDDGKLFKHKYVAKYNEELQLNIKTKNFTIFLPYNQTVTYTWNLNPLTKNTVLNDTFIKECRTPIYDIHKEGTDYSMQVFKFQHENNTSEKLVFKYIRSDKKIINNEEAVKEIIININ
jgi:hypothetical protein